MEIITGIAVTVFIGWAGWISITTIQNKASLQAMDKNDESMAKSMDELKVGIKGLSDRLDLFLKNEIDELKKIADRS